MNKKEQSILFFDQKAEAYDHDCIGDHARRLYPFMLNEVIHIFGDEVLDLGCGTGAFMKDVLSEDSHRHVVGVDISENMISQAKRKLKDKAVFLLADAQDIPLADHSIDLIYCIDSFHHYPHPELVLKELHRILKPGGTFLLGEGYLPFLGRMMMNGYYHFAHSGDVRMYSFREYQQLMQPYFSSITYKRLKDHACIVKGVK